MLCFDSFVPVFGSGTLSGFASVCAEITEVDNDDKCENLEQESASYFDSIHIAFLIKRHSANRIIKSKINLQYEEMMKGSPCGKHFHFFYIPPSYPDDWLLIINQNIGAAYTDNRTFTGSKSKIAPGPEAW